MDPAPFADASASVHPQDNQIGRPRFGLPYELLTNTAKHGINYPRFCSDACFGRRGLRGIEDVHPSFPQGIEHLSYIHGS